MKKTLLLALLLAGCKQETQEQTGPADAETRAAVAEQVRLIEREKSFQFLQQDPKNCKHLEDGWAAAGLVLDAYQDATNNLKKAAVLKGANAAVVYFKGQDKGFYTVRARLFRCPHF